jgi:flagellar motor protein MotB
MMNKKPSQTKALPQPKQVAQPKTTAAAAGLKRPVAPPVYKPQAKKTVQTKIANTTTATRKLPAAPPVYRPQQTPKVLQTKKAPGQPVQPAQARRQPVAAPAARPQTIQRAEKIPGFPGFFYGELPPENRGGTFNTVWSQTEAMEDDSSTVAHSSVKLSKGSRQHLVGFAQVTHLEDEENTHAEDRLAVFAQQRAIEMSYKSGKLPASIVISDFFVSASPCSSTFGTSSKSTGCTENLIQWATTGLTVKSEMGCSSNVKVTIGTLVVNKLYKSNSYEGAIGSMAALILLRKKGAIGGWLIENDPPLDTSRIDNYAKKG